MKETSRIKGKAIYQPAGAAEEYSLWACNLYKGCDHNCSYCYCKRGPMSHTLGGSHAVLKSTLGDELQAVRIFRKELDKYRTRIVEDGSLFFSFSSDPFLPQTKTLSMTCIDYALSQGVPIYILTKAVNWLYQDVYIGSLYAYRHLLHIGFTLTGHDEMEPGAPSTQERIKAISRLHEMQFSVFASIEPVIDFNDSLSCIIDIMPFVRELRIGLLSPYSPRRYDWTQCDRFIDKVTELSLKHGVIVRWKESINRFYKENRPDDMHSTVPDGCTITPTAKRTCHPVLSASDKKPSVSLQSALMRPPCSEEAFRQQVRQSVEQRLKVFTKQENFFMALGPLVIADIAWKYAVRTTELAAKYRIEVLKKLSRTVGVLYKRYDELLRKNLDDMGIKRISTLSQKFLKVAANDFTVLWCSMNNDIRRLLPNAPYQDMRTEALCGYMMLELLKEHNRKMDELIMERCGHHDCAPNPTLDSLRDAMDAYISPDKLVLSDNARLSVKILYNKLSQMDFVNEKP